MYVDHFVAEIGIAGGTCTCLHGFVEKCTHEGEGPNEKRREETETEGWACEIARGWRISASPVFCFSVRVYSLCVCVIRGVLHVCECTGARACAALVRVGSALEFGCVINLCRFEPAENNTLRRFGRKTLSATRERA